MSNEFGSDHGLIHEAVVTGRKVGAGQEFWSALAHSDKLFTKVVAFVTTMLTPIFRCTQTINRDMAGWICVEPAEVVDEFEPIICEFLQPGETQLGGEEMVKRARQQGINDSAMPKLCFGNRTRFP